MVVEFKNPFNVKFEFTGKLFEGTVVALIPAYTQLTDRELKKYCDLKEGDEHYYNVGAPARVPRYIMKKSNGYSVILPQRLININFRG